ncbi:MSH5-like protein, partial [Mya arenaria]
MLFDSEARPSLIQSLYCFTCKMAYMGVLWHGGKLGVAYYDLDTTIIHVMLDAQEDDSFKFLLSVEGSDSPETAAEICKRRVLSMDLPYIPSHYTYEERTLRISSLIPFENLCMVRAMGGLLKYLEKMRIGIELEEMGTKLPVLDVKIFTLTWFQRPLKNAEKINSRQTAIAYLNNPQHVELVLSLEDAVKNMKNISITETFSDDLHRITNFINKIVDFQECSIQGRFVVKSGVDEQLDQKKRVFSELPEVMTKVALDELNKLEDYIGYLLAIPESAITDPYRAEKDYEIEELKFVVALIVFLAQVGSFIPAEEARLGLTLESLHNGEELVFLYQLVEGHTSSSYACHVAAKAGLPPAIIRREFVKIQRKTVNNIVYTNNGEDKLCVYRVGITNVEVLIKQIMFLH